MLIGMITVLAAVGGAAICCGFGGFADLRWMWLLPAGFVGCFLALSAVAFLILWTACALVDISKPQLHDSRFYRGLLNFYLPIAPFVLLTKFRAEGLEKVPTEGRFMIVCNHISEVDPVTLLYYLPKAQLAFISKRENATMFIVGKVMHKIMCQMINRENDREALKTILKCIQLLKDDEVSIGVFPEGYINDEHKLAKFRPGVFKIATKTNVPIVVTTIIGSETVFHNMVRLRRSHVELHVLDVIRPEQYAGKTAVEISDTIHAMMAADLGPERILQTEENA